MRKRTVSIVLSCALASEAIAANAQVKVTRGRADERRGEELRCRVAMDERRFTESLTAAAWTEKTLPKIDWSSQAAIIIAPHFYVQDYRPAFVGLKTENEKVILEWKLREEPPDLADDRRSSSSFSSGSTAIGPEILILVVPRTAIESKKVSCKGPKRKES